MVLAFGKGFVSAIVSDRSPYLWDCIGALAFLAGLLQGQPLLLMFLTAVSLAVAAIPEALPAVVTISLALGARKLVRHQALVRNLPAVETLGSVTYICSDKTGTLTQNRMSLELLLAAGEERETLAAGLGAAPWDELGQALALSNDVALRDGRPAGEPTELALYHAAAAAGLDKATMEAALPRLAELPFDSQRKLMTTLHRDGEGVLALVKGAPEVLLPRCADQLGSDGPEPLAREALLQRAQVLARRGYRVLALAERRLPALPDPLVEAEQELTLLGLAALIDPPRPEAAQAVADCRSAGIVPVMITGDHPGTAHAIASRLGIAQDGDGVMTGRQLAKLDDAELSYSVLANAASRVAGWLRELGVAPGDRVGVTLPNIPQMPIIYYGILWAGGVVVPMNPLYKSREFAFVLSDADAKVFFACS
mgnify:CR=1 FL=1